MKKLAAVVLGLCLISTVHAQTVMPQPAFDEVRVVTYVDLEPGLAASGLSLLMKDVKSEVQSTGCRDTVLIEENGRPNHFLIVERWHRASDREAAHKSDSYKQFRIGLQPMLASPLDERTGHRVAP